MAYVSARTILFPLFRSRLAEALGTEHLPQQGPYLLAANHIDFLDGFFIATVVHDTRSHNVYFLTKTRNYWWTKATIPIDAQHRSVSLDEALVCLRQGKVICNFIEGQRNPAKTLGSAKTGTARLALHANVPVIPVGITGPSSRNFAQALTTLMTSKGYVSLRFGRELDLSSFRGQPLNAAVLDHATHAIMRALAPLTGKAYAG